MTDEIKKNTPKVTGKSAASVDFTVSHTANTAELQITAKKFFRVVETGRGPTKSGASKSTPSLVDAIKEWLKAKGESDVGMAYAISKRIHKKGTKLYQQGGRKDVFSNVLNERAIDKLGRNLQDAIAEYYLQDFIKNLEKNKLIK
jgi:hypothetical protein